jgi:hypothetical protein
MNMRILALVLWIALPMPAALAQQREEVFPKIYEVKYRSPEDIARILEGFASRIAISPTFKTITVIATEKGHVVIAELIRKYDVPARAIELQFHLVRASASGSGTKDALPSAIRGVINDIAALTRYKSFELLDTPVLRAYEGKDVSLSGKGAYFYMIGVGQGGPSIVTLDKKREIQLNDFHIDFTIPFASADPKSSYRNIGVRTALNIGDGETVVVGASQIQEEAAGHGAAIITIVTARILN